MLTSSEKHHLIVRVKLAFHNPNMSGLFNSFIKVMAGPYKKVLASRLRTYG